MRFASILACFGVGISSKGRVVQIAHFLQKFVFASVLRQNIQDSKWLHLHKSRMPTYILIACSLPLACCSSLALIKSLLWCPGQYCLVHFC